MRHSVLRQQLAAESVAFQSPVFFQELTGLFAELQSANKKSLEESPLLTQLSKVVKHHTNLDVSFHIGDLEPCVEIPAVNKNNVLINSYLRNWLSSSDGLKMIDNAGGIARGSVSILTGKVSGIYADVKHDIHLPKHMFVLKQYSSSEVAAITLHEIGHLFTYYEYMTRVVTTNQVLAGVAKALDGTDSIHEREAVLTRAKTELKLKELDTAALAKSRNGKVVEVVIVTQRVKETESELGANICDMTSWEYLADQYAARMGAGRDLVTALEKIYRTYGDRSFRTSGAYIFFEAMKMVLVIGGAIVTFMPGGAIGIIAVLYGGLFILADSQPDQYDPAGARIKRVRDQITQRLKDKKISSDERERLVADLEVLDTISKQANDRRQLLSVVWDFLSPSARAARSQLLLQQQLEDLAANDLFAKAAEIRQLA